MSKKNISDEDFETLKRLHPNLTYTEQPLHGESNTAVTANTVIENQTVNVTVNNPPKKPRKTRAKTVKVVEAAKPEPDAPKPNEERPRTSAEWDAYRKAMGPNDPNVKKLVPGERTMTGGIVPPPPDGPDGPDGPHIKVKIDDASYRIGHMGDTIKAQAAADKAAKDKIESDERARIGRMGNVMRAEATAEKAAKDKIAHERDKGARDRISHMGDAPVPAPEAKAVTAKNEALEAVKAAIITIAKATFARKMGDAVDMMPRAHRNPAFADKMFKFLTLGMKMPNGVHGSDFLRPRPEEEAEEDHKPTRKKKKEDAHADIEAHRTHAKEQRHHKDDRSKTHGLLRRIFLAAEATHHAVNRHGIAHEALLEKFREGFYDKVAEIADVKKSHAKHGIHAIATMLVAGALNRHTPNNFFHNMYDKMVPEGARENIDKFLTPLEKMFGIDDSEAGQKKRRILTQVLTGSIFTEAVGIGGPIDIGKHLLGALFGGGGLGGGLGGGGVMGIGKLLGLGALGIGGYKVATSDHPLETLKSIFTETVEVLKQIYNAVSTIANHITGEHIGHFEKDKEGNTKFVKPSEEAENDTFIAKGMHAVHGAITGSLDSLGIPGSGVLAGLLMWKGVTKWLPKLIGKIGGFLIAQAKSPAVIEAAAAATEAIVVAESAGIAAALMGTILAAAAAAAVLAAGAIFTGKTDQQRYADAPTPEAKQAEAKSSFSDLSGDAGSGLMDWVKSLFKSSDTKPQPDGTKPPLPTEGTKPPLPTEGTKPTLAPTKPWMDNDAFFPKATVNHVDYDGPPSQIEPKKKNGDIGNAIDPNSKEHKLPPIIINKGGDTHVHGKGGGSSSAVERPTPGVGSSGVALSRLEQLVFGTQGVVA